MATKSTTKKTTNSKTATKTATKTPAKKTTSKMAKKISEADIRKKAQEIYDKRILSGVPGNAEEDWLKAEAELMKKN